MTVNDNPSIPSIFLDSYLTTRRVFQGGKYLAGYAKIVKHKCEIYNFISPTLRILYFCKGTSDWMIDGHLNRICPGDVVILSNICKRNIHEVLDESIVYEMYEFYPTVFTQSYMWKVFFTNRHVAASRDDLSCAPVYVYLDQLRREMLSDDDRQDRKDCIVMLLNLLAAEFYRRTDTSAAGLHLSVYQISESVQYITENLDEELRVKDIANRYGYTTEHYSRLFKQYFGITPMQYIVSSRIENAIRLMERRGTTVLDAAYSSGFRNSSAFYKAFKSYKGMSPTEYFSGIRREPG